MSATPRNDPPPTLPWWRYGMVWLVIGGPVSAVIAGLTTVWIAERNADVEIIDPPAVSSAAVTPAPKAAVPPAATAVGR